MAQRRLALLVCLLAPSLAAAQITITESNDTDKIINQAECQGGADGLSFQWTFPGFTTGTSGASYTLSVSDTENCPAPSTTTGQIVNTKPVGSVAAASASGVFPATGTTGVSGLLTLAGMNCNSTNQLLFFCVTLSGAAAGTQVTGSIQLDLLKPAPPTATTADPGDSRLLVHWTQGTTGVDGGTPGSPDSYVITAIADNDATDKHVTGRLSGGTATTSGTIEHLKNDVLYNITVEALSPGGNPSGPSNTIQGTPVAVNDFWRVYRNDGGREQGGCAAGAAGMLALLAVPLALRAWRRRS
jgi:hypothetical protein